jgi:hypothetical protein
MFRAGWRWRGALQTWSRYCLKDNDCQVLINATLVLLRGRGLQFKLLCDRVTSTNGCIHNSEERQSRNHLNQSILHESCAFFFYVCASVCVH